MLSNKIMHVRIQLLINNNITKTRVCNIKKCNNQKYKFEIKCARFQQ